MRWVIIVLLVSCTASKPVSREVIKLDGSGSTWAVSFHWRQIAGGSVVIESPSDIITYGKFSGKGVYKFELTVTGMNGMTDKDTATVVKK